MSSQESIGMERMTITLTPNGKVAVTCDHCGLDELIPGDRIGAFIRGRVAAHAQLMATSARVLR